MRRIIVNERATGASKLTIYDTINTFVLATTVAIIDLVNNLGSINYDLDFNDGLSYTVTGSAFDVTIVYD